MRTHLFVTSASVFVLVACNAAVEPWPPELPPVRPDGGPIETSCTKPSALEGVDPTTLPACTGTKGVNGRCVAREGLGEFKDTFEQASCDASAACVPDEVVSKGASIELKKCKAVLDGEGRCFWALAKDIIENYDILKGATGEQCAADQVCAPCINPIDKTSTRVCELGGGGGAAKPANCPPPAPPPPSDASPAPKADSCPYTGTPIDTAAFPELDCGSNMVCIGASLIGNPELAKQLKPCATGVCAPRKSVAAAGKLVPKTCTSIANAEGRCTNASVPAVASKKDALPVADCDADERCVPCFDPTSGAETGACSTVSCDKPAKPATKLAACCGGKATCVPKASVPSAQQSSLGKDSCQSSGDLCVPNAYVQNPVFQPKACKSSLPFIGGKGACVSRCIPKAGLLLQDGCDAGEACAPCSQLPAGTTACNK